MIIMKTSIRSIGLLAAFAMGFISPLFSQVPDLTKDAQSVDSKLTYNLGATGLVIDHLDADAAKTHFAHITDQILKSRLSLDSMRVMFADSIEIDNQTDWTDSFVAEFRKRRGYDPIPYLPVLKGKCFADPQINSRFQHDYQKTVGDLWVDGHYRASKEFLNTYGMQLVAEGGHGGYPRVEPLKAMGVDDIPRGEFWNGSQFWVVKEALGTGYDYDVINSDVIENRMETKDGRLVLPHGVGYEVIVLPERPNMPLSTLTKLETLVREGATLLGPKPERDTTLADYPRRDEQIKAIAERMWGAGKAEQAYGKGRVIADRKRVRETLQQRGIGPDFSYTSPEKPADLDYIHRRTQDADIYFVTNTTMDDAEADCTFRVTSRLPQFWHADTVKIESCTDYQRVPGGMKLKLRLPPAGSIFVVFSGAAPETDPTPQPKENSKPAAPLDITGPWEVRFPPNLGAPPSRVFDELVSWTEIPDDGIKYFSGTATYLKEFEVPPSKCPSKAPTIQASSDPCSCI